MWTLQRPALEDASRCIREVVEHGPGIDKLGLLLCVRPPGLEPGTAEV